MRILVAGGSGMIGSNVVRILKSQHHHVTIADLSTFYDLRARPFCAAAVKNVDRVFHLADRTVGIGYSSTHHGQMMTDSLLISLNLLEAAREAGVREYLYTSSSCVYSDLQDRPVAEDNVAVPERANEGYGWAKLIAERQAIYYAREYGIRTVIARPANIFGPSYDWTRPVEDMHVIPALICKMLRGDGEIIVWGDGGQTRTFQYEADAAARIVALAEQGVAGEAYNLGGGELAISDVVATLVQACRYEGIVTYDASKPTGPARKSQDTSKITALLGPLTNSLAGVEQTVLAARKALHL